MKNKILTVIVLISASLNIFAQFPNSFNYQAVARTNEGLAIANTAITVETTILKGSNCDQNPGACTDVWQELHFPTTNDYGMFNINIGAGQTTFAGSATNFDVINWSDFTGGNYYMRIRVDFGNSQFLNGMVDIGTVKLQSVPYTLSSQNALDLVRTSSKVSINLTELSDVNVSAPAVNDFLVWNGTKWINSASSITIPSVLDDLSDVSISSPATNQVLFYNGTNWANSLLPFNSLSGVSISSPTNGQLLSYNGANWVNQNPIWIDDGTNIYANNNKKIGVNTTIPLSGFHINFPAATPFSGAVFLVTGTYDASDNGQIDISGSGSKMFFSPTKAAFRAGKIDGAQWDVGNVGNYSAAFGYNSIASGNYSFATGGSNVASQIYTTAFGYSNIASNSYSTVIGRSNTASGTSSFAGGDGNNVSSGLASFAFGSETNASSSLSVSLGLGTNSNAYASLAIGRYNNVNGVYSPTTWISTDAIFIIGDGTSSSATSNALVIYKNGNINSKGTFSTVANPTKSPTKILNFTDILNVESYLDDKKNFSLNPYTLKKYYPNLVSDFDGNPAINYIGIVPILLENIKQQSSEIEQLRNENQQLKQQLQDIDTRLQKLENK